MVSLRWQVYDSCGMAGGSPTWTGTQLSFIDTKNAKQVGACLHLLGFYLLSNEFYSQIPR